MREHLNTPVRCTGLCVQPFKLPDLVVLQGPPYVDSKTNGCSPCSNVWNSTLNDLAWDIGVTVGGAEIVTRVKSLLTDSAQP